MRWKVIRKVLLTGQANVIKLNYCICLVSAPEFVFEHGYQTYLPSESSEPPTAAIVSTPSKARSRKSTSSLTQKKLNCCYPGKMWVMLPSL